MRASAALAGQDVRWGNMQSVKTLPQCLAMVDCELVCAAAFRADWCISPLTYWGGNQYCPPAGMMEVLSWSPLHSGAAQTRQRNVVFVVSGRLLEISFFSPFVAQMALLRSLAIKTLCLCTIDCLLHICCCLFVVYRFTWMYILITWLLHFISLFFLFFKCCNSGVSTLGCQ